MKPLLFILLAVSLASCQKKQCWKCHVTSYSDRANHPDSVYKFDVPEPVCDKTKKEIRQYEEDSKHSIQIGPNHFATGDFDVSCD